MRFFSKTLDKLKGALKKTAAVLNTDVRTLFVPGRQIDDAWLAEMEEKFIRADIGADEFLLHFSQPRIIDLSPRHEQRAHVGVEHRRRFLQRALEFVEGFGEKSHWSVVSRQLSVVSRSCN